MAQLKKVVAEIVVPILRNGWSLDELTKTLRALARQDAAFAWRVSVVDASRTETVRSLVEAILPEARVNYEPIHTKSGYASDLLYQGVGACKSRYVTYCLPGSEWAIDQLQRLVGAARQSESDVIVQGRSFTYDDVVAMIEAGRDPCAGCLVLHTSAIYDNSVGWPRGQQHGFAADVWRSMFLAGGEFFAVRAPDWTPAVVDSTEEQEQLMLFGDA